MKALTASDGRRADVGAGVGRAGSPLVAAALAASAAAIVAQATGVPPGVRFAALLVFFCTGPGTALLVLLGRSPDRLGVAPVVAVSLSLVVLTAQLLLWTGAWAPDIASYAAAALCIALILVGHSRARRGGS